MIVQRLSFLDPSMPAPAWNASIGYAPGYGYPMPALQFPNPYGSW